MTAASACHRASPVSNTEDLDELVVPTALRLRAGELALVRGDLPRAFELIGSAPDEPPGTVAAALEPLLTAALDTHQRELAVAALSSLEERAPSAPSTRALALRVADAGSTTVAERRLLDQRVRQLLADVERAETPASDALRARLCSALEGLYWARYVSVSEPAYQIDALLAHRSVCGRATSSERSLAALHAEALAAEERGQPETAVAFYEQVIQVSEPSAARAALESEAREAVHRLLWPTFLERTNQRFDHHAADDLVARGLFVEATRDVAVQVALPVPPGCELPEVTECPALMAAATTALAERFDAVAREAFEMPPRAGGPPVVRPPEPALVRREGATAYFAGSLPLDRLIRAMYDNRPSPWNDR